MYFESILFFAAAASSLSDKDEHDAVMFVQSHFTPKVFEICKSGAGKTPASDYDSALNGWLKKNGRAVRHGEHIMRDAAKQEGKDFERAMAQQDDEAMTQVKAYSPSELVEHCDYLLSVVRSEL